MFTAGSACTGTYRALKMWEAAVTEAGSLDSTTSSRRSTTPASPRARAVRPRWCPGQHHVRMNMYIAQSQGGTFKVVKNLGHIDPNEPQVPMG